jgi:hypothetical protein
MIRHLNIFPKQLAIERIPQMHIRCLLQTDLCEL